MALPSAPRFFAFERCSAHHPAFVGIERPFCRRVALTQMRTGEVKTNWPVIDLLRISEID
jgi:hypothetical protein